MAESPDKPALEQAGILFQSEELENLLNTIDELRSQGLNQYIDLPQLIVCGDQSSGKSSVLEAISGVRFPTKDNLCTRFPTELILRRSPKVSSNASIVLSADGSNSHQISQAKYDVLRNFEAIIAAASKAMGLDQGTKVFSDQILRVELSGPKLPNLTLVDLPGLFHAQNKAQSADDAEVVKNMVTGYLKMPRSIILAVVSAKNDYANQIVTKYATDVDPKGERTMGIVTKPDTLDDGSESQKQYFDLVQNHDVHLRLGWHILRNRDFTTKDCTAEERDNVEAEFFSTGIWSRLKPSQLGIGALKPRLSSILQDQIIAELPNLVKEVTMGVSECQARLKKLGSARPTGHEQRIFLHRISQDFSRLIVAAVQGHYEDPFFQDGDGGSGYQKRIRAVAFNLLDEFAKNVALKGHKYHVLDNAAAGAANPNFGASTATFGIPTSVFVNPFANPFKGPIKVTREQRLARVGELIKENRGMELPGFQRSEHITMLFREQCAPWTKLIRDSTTAIFDQTKQATYSILHSVTDPATALSILKLIVNPAFENIRRDLEQRVDRNLDQHVRGHPITFNHYFTENLQKLRIGHEARSVIEQLTKKFGNNQEPMTIKSVAAAITTKTEADMHKFTCSEALHFMEAYYKVALKFFIDDYSIHTIEEGLLAQLKSIFEPAKAFSLEDDLVGKIAGESEECQADRAKLTLKLQKLEEALSILRNLDRGSSTAMWAGKQAHKSRTSVRTSSPSTSVKSDDSEL